jgi:hypothetical protein
MDFKSHAPALTLAPAWLLSNIWAEARPARLIFGGEIG